MTENTATEDFMSSYLKWERYDSNRFLVHNDGGNFGKKLVPESCLTALHPQLPIAIDALLHLSKTECGIAVAFGHHIGYTLNYLQGALVKVDDASGRAHYFNTICSISTNTSDADILSLGGYKCVIETVHLNTVSVCVATDIDWCEIQCSRLALEQQYQGCYTRWQAGWQIGLDPTELTEMVFKSNMTASTDVTSINDVTFE